jgi:hypothetical protein
MLPVCQPEIVGLAFLFQEGMMGDDWVIIEDKNSKRLAMPEKDFFGMLRLKGMQLRDLTANHEVYIVPWPQAELDKFSDCVLPIPMDRPLCTSEWQREYSKYIHSGDTAGRIQNAIGLGAAGALAGSMLGPAGAIVGGLIGVLVGKKTKPW